MFTQGFGDPKKPPHEVIDKNLECGGGDDNAIKRIKELIRMYKDYSDIQKGEGDINRNPDYRAKPGAEHIEEILRLVASLDKPLKGTEGIVLALKQGDIMPIDELLNPREVQAPTEL